MALNFTKNLNNKNVEDFNASTIKNLRGAIHEGFDKTADLKKVKNVPIRLCFVSMDGVNQDAGKVQIATTYGVTCVYNLPQGMSLEDASKIISYLTEKFERKNGLETGSEMALRIVASEMGNYGFRKRNYMESDFNHAYSESELDEATNTIIVSTGSDAKSHIDGVVDFMTIGGDQSLFLCSDLAENQFSWFKPNVSFDEMKKIYEKIGYEARFDGVSKKSTPVDNERAF